MSECQGRVVQSSVASRILVIDDEAAVRESVCGVLSDLGYIVAEAGDGVAGVDSLRSSAADAVVMDIYMPVRDGFETIRELRRGIHALNEEGRARLLASFETVDKNFRELFSALFEGGEARLELTEADDPLAAGLEVYAKPPGKRPHTLSLRAGIVSFDALRESLKATPLAAELDEDERPRDEGRLPPRAWRVSRTAPRRLVSHVGTVDRDMVPAFLAHYTSLGVTQFHVILHGPAAARRALRAALATHPVHVEDEWDGAFEGLRGRWLRWCTRDGLVPTGAERAESEKARAENEKARAGAAEAEAERERERAARLAARLRALGVDPESDS